MSLPEDYLQYPKRGHGMDHDRYTWSMLKDRPKVTWPNGARVALWGVTQLQWFPLDMKPARILRLGLMIVSAMLITLLMMMNPR